MAYNTALFNSLEDAANRTNVLGRVPGFAGASDQITPYLTGLYNFHFFDSDAWIVASAGVAFVPATPLQLPHIVLAGTGLYHGVSGTASAQLMPFVDPFNATSSIFKWDLVLN